MRRELSVAVMLGGASEEREVSLRSGAAVARALEARGHRVTRIDPQHCDWRLPADTDVVFLALHGRYGEDGTVQRELERLGVPYTGCGPEVSRLAFDKRLAKERFVAAGVPTPRYAVLESQAQSCPSGWTPPLVLKPVKQGSSVGLQFVDVAEAWSRALAEALRFDGQVLLEERVIGLELTVALLAGEALPIVAVRPKRGAYDYDNKYTSGATDYECPAALSPAATERVQSAALRAFDSLGGGDYARVDVMLGAGDSPFVLEVNTLPGMTETSLFPKAAAAAGIGFAELCERMLALALRRPRADVVVRTVS